MVWKGSAGMMSLRRYSPTKEPMSVEFCHEVGLTYVSCSTYRVPIARLAAAQAAIKAELAAKAAKKAKRK